MSFLQRTLPRATSTLTSASAAQRTFSTTRMNALAKMQIIGRLADTPELMPTSTGRELVRYSLGVGTGPRDEEGNRATSWFRVASFSEGPQREVLLKLPKGTLMYLEADAKMDTFQNSEGKNVTQLNLLQRKLFTFQAEFVKPLGELVRDAEKALDEKEKIAREKANAKDKGKGKDHKDGQR